jgi:glycosyltransferase involved in cell wall biosynthesis
LRKILCIAWAPSSPRLDEIAAEIGAARANLTFHYGPIFLAPLRYTVLFLRTLILLLSNGPDVVYAQNPAIFCPFTCLIYCKIAGKRLLIDHHCVWAVKSFRGTKLGRLIFLIERTVDRLAYANTAPHWQWGKMLRGMGARKVTVIYDYVERTVASRDQNLRAKYGTGFSLISLAPHGGHPLERVDSETFAAGRNPSVGLLITGPPEKMLARISKIKQQIPRNVKYLGLLPRDEYERLKSSVDFGMNISDEPYTVSHSLLEFAAVSTPMISTRQAAVEELFGESVLYTDSSDPDAVARKLSQLVNDPSLLSEFREKITRRLEFVRASRRVAIQELLRIVAE